MRFPIRVEATSGGAARVEARARGHVLVVDEPEERHGTDEGMTPLETLLAAFAGCTNVILHKIAGERGVTLRIGAINVEGHLDPRGVRRNVQVERAFPEIDLEVSCATDADAATLEEIRRELRHRCPVSHVLRASGSEVRETWHVSPLGE